MTTARLRFCPPGGFLSSAARTSALSTLRSLSSKLRLCAKVGAGRRRGLELLMPGVKAARRPGSCGVALTPDLAAGPGKPGEPVAGHAIPVCPLAAIIVGTTLAKAFRNCAKIDRKKIPINS